MLNFIEKLREKPEQDRKKILFATVFVLMAIIIFLWATNLDAIFQAKPTDTSTAEVVSSSPFKIFSEKLSYMKDTISNEINLIKK